MSQRLFFFGIIALFFTVALLPVLVMVADTLISAKGVDFSAYAMLLHSKSLQQSFVNSLWLSVSVAAMTTLFGVMLGVVLEKTTLPFKMGLIFLFVIPLLIPPYILALGWFEFVGREGVPGELLFGFWGTFWVLFSVYLPIPILLTILFLKQIDPRLEEAGLLITGWGGVLKGITLPLIRPALFLSFILVFILSFGEYSVANFLRYPVFPLESFTAFSAFYDFKTATVLAMPMLLVAFIVLMAEQFFVHKHFSGFTTSYRTNRISLGKYRYIVLLTVVVVVMVVVCMPLFTLFVKAAHWQTLLEAWQKGYEPMLRTLFYGAAGASLLVIFGFLSGYIIQQKLFGWWRLYDASILFMFTLSPIVIGIALILFWNRPATNFIYNTPLIILFGYLGKYLALTTKITQTRLSQIPPSMIEAAQMAGADWLEILRFILVPLSKKTLLIAWMIGFIFSLRENTITMLVYPPGLEPLPVYIITQMANGKPEVVAALSVIMIGMTLLPLAILLFVRKGEHD